MASFTKTNSRSAIHVRRCVEYGKPGLHAGSGINRAGTLQINSQFVSEFQLIGDLEMVVPLLKIRVDTLDINGDGFRLNVMDCLENALS